MTEPECLATLEASLPQKIKTAHAATRLPPTAEEISTIVQQTVSTLTGDVTAGDLKFYVGLQELASFIRNARKEIAEIQPKDITVSHIPLATDELDAVVEATEEAANKIMDVCDMIQDIAIACKPEVNEKLVACTTRIFEACNFQDITGQRITKVVTTLKRIDKKVEALLKALGEEINRNGEARAIVNDDSDALLHGPQLPKNAVDQAAIDKLLSGE
jgi:chemotaxis protein CheZ